MHKILVIGRVGQIGAALSKVLTGAQFIDEYEIDLARPALIKKTLQEYDFDILINAAAYTNVEKAEEHKDLARLINATSVRELAEYCAEDGKIMIHYSTDYVYKGTGNKPQAENSDTNPLNYYGQTKLEGDNHIINSGCKHLILRTSWVYSDNGHNFLDTMLRLAAERELLEIVSDQIGAPTYAGDIAACTAKLVDLIDTKSKFGIYNMCAKGETSWHGFAEYIFEKAKENGADLKIKEVRQISSKDFKCKAKRPRNSRLDCSKLKEDFGIELPEWQKSCELLLGKIYETGKLPA